jgi:hypothetical protein
MRLDPPGVGQADVQTERAARWLGLLVIDGLLLRYVTIRWVASLCNDQAGCGSAYLPGGYPATYEHHGAG